MSEGQVKRWGWGVMAPASLTKEQREAIELGRHQIEDGQFILYADHAAIVDALKAQLAAKDEALREISMMSSTTKLRRVAQAALRGQRREGGSACR